MADTMHQHEVDMKNTGYENFSNEANNALDNTLDAVKKNSVFQEAIIGNMLDTVTLDYENTYKHLGTVLDDYGLKTSETFKKNISDVADFNRELGKVADTINKIDTSKITGVSNGGGVKIPENIATGSESSNNAGQNPTLYSLKIKGKPLYMMVGDKIKKSVVWSPSNPPITTLEWSSTDTSICTIDKNGKVTAKKKGKATIKVKSTEYSSATDICSVYVISSEYKSGISAIETSYGKSLTDSQKQEVYKNIYKSTYDNTNGVNQITPDGETPDKTWLEATNNTAAVLLKDWFDALPNRPEGTEDIPSGTSALASYFMKKGKKVNRYDLQKLADILQIETPGAMNYESWGNTLKNKILSSYKKFGFAKGGIVRHGIPANILDMIGADALIPRGDSVLIGANPGETVLTEEFTKQLKPTVATLNEFNNKMLHSTPTLPLLQNGETNMNNEYNFTINVDSISGEQDIKKLAYKIGDIITERNKRDWKKIR